MLVCLGAAGFVESRWHPPDLRPKAKRWADVGLSKAKDIPAGQPSDKSSSVLLSVASLVQQPLKIMAAAQKLFALQSLCTQRPCWAFCLDWQVVSGQGTGKRHCSCDLHIFTGDTMKILFIPDTIGVASP